MGPWAAGVKLVSMILLLHLHGASADHGAHKQGTNHWYNGELDQPLRAASLLMHTRDRTHRSASRTVGSNRHTPECVPRLPSCEPELVQYSPSSLEQRWFQGVRAWQTDDPEWEHGCEVALQHKQQYLLWIGTAMNRRGSNHMESGLDEDIFSKYTWRNPCTHRTYDTYIEPLADILRSPFAWCFKTYQTPWQRLAKNNHPPPAESQCAAEPGGCRKYHRMSTSYLLMPSGEEVDRKSPAGMRYFFDLGSTRYNNGISGEDDSFKWFKETFEARGVVFDHILAWEAMSVDQQQYWDAMPDDVTFKFQFFNVPAVAAPDHKHNPLTHVLKRTKPEDYVVLKLDIDATQVEELFIDQILTNPELIARIDELFWEHHVWKHPFANVPGRAWRLGTVLRATNQTLADSYDLFTRLRNAGIKAHSWT